MLRKSDERDTLEHVFETASLSIVGTEPTHFHNGGSSLLDIIATNRLDKMIRFNQISVPGLSKHDMIFCSFDINVDTQLRENTYRDYINFDRMALQSAMANIPWEQYYQMDDVNQITEFFSTHVVSVHDACIPLRTAKNRKMHKPLFNDSILKAILEFSLVFLFHKTIAHSEFPSTLKENKKKMRKNGMSIH